MIISSWFAEMWEVEILDHWHLLFCQKNLIHFSNLIDVNSCHWGEINEPIFLKFSFSQKIHFVFQHSMIDGVLIAIRFL